MSTPWYFPSHVCLHTAALSMSLLKMSYSYLEQTLCQGNLNQGFSILTNRRDPLGIMLNYRLQGLCCTHETNSVINQL